jgi:hypothetical protein
MDKFKFDQTIPSSDSYDSVCCFDDEVDAALAPDFRVSKMVNELSEVEIDDEDDNEYIDDVDITNDDIEDPDVEDVDAEDLKDAEKDIMANPFEDDEVIDAAIGDSDTDELDIDLDED